MFGQVNTWMDYNSYAIIISECTSLCVIVNTVLWNLNIAIEYPSLGDNTKPSDQDSTSRVSQQVHYCTSGLVTQTNGCLEFSFSKHTEDRETLAVSLHAGLKHYSAKLNYILYVYAAQKGFSLFF